MYPNSLRNLIESFKLLPGVGEKTAERLAFFVMDLEEEKANFFVESIEEVKSKIKKCPICSNITEDEICSICSSNERNKDLLCVLEDKKNIFLFEKLGSYNGFYHVIDNLISPLDGINPEDIGLEKLLKRIKMNYFSSLIFKIIVVGNSNHIIQHLPYPGGP